jgi:hypothetical protein
MQANRKRIPSNRPDFIFENHFSLCLLKCCSDEARAWVEENVNPEGYQPDWPNLIVEPRYAENLLLGLQSDGLTVAA